jgi:DNA-binding NarL/FixJ family response regulator
MALDNKLASTIKNTYNGLVIFDRKIYEKHNSMMVGDMNNRHKLSVLSKTEIEILKLIVKGKSNAEIASELFLTEGTIRNYVSNVFIKLDCKNSRELAVFGLKTGL